MEEGVNRHGHVRLLPGEEMAPGWEEVNPTKAV